MWLGVRQCIIYPWISVLRGASSEPDVNVWTIFRDSRGHPVCKTG